jgi:hypothetical protein
LITKRRLLFQENLEDPWRVDPTRSA